MNNFQLKSVYTKKTYDIEVYIPEIEPFAIVLKLKRMAPIKFKC